MRRKDVQDNILVETDFLFSLRPGEKAHEAALNILRDSQKGIYKLYISPASPIEASLVMSSYGLKNKEVSRALRVMEEAIRLYINPIYPELSLANLGVAADLREKHELTFFDSIHAAVALSYSLIYIGGDKRVREALASEGGRAKPL